MKNGLLLINLGSPDNPSPRAVRKYLAKFLADKRVINLPGFLRYFLLYGAILPFRPQRSSVAYQKIWTPQGSPLILHSQNLAKQLQAELGKDWIVVLGMRYGKPALSQALANVVFTKHLTILPLFPQYSSAASGSPIQAVMQWLALQERIPSFTLIRDFYQHPLFIKAQAQIIKPYVNAHDYILFSYHGIPENHLFQHECKTLCKIACSESSPLYESCYRSQCKKTTELLAAALQLAPHHYGMSFQSRLGKTPWIQPYTDKILEDLAKNNIKKLAIACPSFVADCLETLEEIGIRGREQWTELGGKEFTLIPSLNADKTWVEAIIAMVKSAS